LLRLLISTLLLPESDAGVLTQLKIVYILIDHTCLSQDMILTGALAPMGASTILGCY